MSAKVPVMAETSDPNVGWKDMADYAGGPGGGPHVSSHQNTGNDELNVTGLSGELADPQPPKAHTHAQSEVTGLVSDLAGKQGLDATLTALAALNITTGLLEQTGADTFTKRAIGVATGTDVPTRNDADARYAAASHTQAQSTITNLVSDLAAKLSGVTLQAFTTPGANVYTPTAGMKHCIVISTGGGGGGGGADATTTNDPAGAGGGGAGGTCIEAFSAATIGANQTVTIGSAGNAGSGTNGTNGTAGGNTTFGALHTANGGAFGTGTGIVTNSVNVAAGGAGGVPSGGLLNITGGDGDDGIGICIDGTIDASYGMGGSGGASFWGGGGKQVTAATASITTTGSIAGVAGKAYGSGGSGAAIFNTATGVNGGAGAAGVCLVIEFS